MRINYLFLLSTLIILIHCEDRENKATSPLENLPPWIERITQFGQRADFSHDGKRILFLEKTFGDVYEVETQNFRPPDENEIIFSVYVDYVAEVMGLDIETGTVINYTNAPPQYDEPEGIFPNGKYTLVESDKHNQKGPVYGLSGGNRRGSTWDWTWHFII